MIAQGSVAGVRDPDLRPSRLEVERPLSDSDRRHHAVPHGIDARHRVVLEVGHPDPSSPDGEALGVVAHGDRLGHRPGAEIQPRDRVVLRVRDPDRAVAEGGVDRCLTDLDRRAHEVGGGRDLLDRVVVMVNDPDPPGRDGHSPRASTHRDPVRYALRSQAHAGDRVRIEVGDPNRWPRDRHVTRPAAHLGRRADHLVAPRVDRRERAAPLVHDPHRPGAHGDGTRSVTDSHGEAHDPASGLKRGRGLGSATRAGLVVVEQQRSPERGAGERQHAGDCPGQPGARTPEAAARSLPAPRNTRRSARPATHRGTTRSTLSVTALVTQTASLPTAMPDGSSPTLIGLPSGRPVFLLIR